MTENTIEDMVDDLDEKNEEDDAEYVGNMAPLILLLAFLVTLLLVFLFVITLGRIGGGAAQIDAQAIAHLIQQQNEGKTFSVMDNEESDSVLISQSSPVWDNNKDGILFVLVKDPKTNSDPQIQEVKVSKGQGLQIQPEGGPAWSVSIYKKVMWESQIARAVTHRYGCKLDTTRTSCQQGWYPTPLDELFTK